MLQEITIKSVLGGHSPTHYFGRADQYSWSMGIDPEFWITHDTDSTSGQMIPTAYTAFSGANVTSYPVAIITNPKNTLIYTVLQNGRLISYTSGLASETLIGTVAGGNAEGAFYYNNYIYITGTGASKNDVSRYGPLNNSPALADGVWTGATLGSQTALTDTTYPTWRNIDVPNHWGHVHVDNQVYFCDFLNGKGMIHTIKTRKVTDEGDTNDNSAYNVLDLPFGFYPTSIVSFGNDLVIGAVQTISADVNQGDSALFFWDTISRSFYKYLPISDPYVTAMKYHNGILYVWSGNAVDGIRLMRYVGGDQLETLIYHTNGTPPLAGAVDALAGRIIWGSYANGPSSADYAASIFAYGSKDDRLPKGLFNVARYSGTTASDNQIITACKFAQQLGSYQPRMIFGWKNTTNGTKLDRGLDFNTETGTINALWQSLPFLINQKFRVVRVDLSFTDAIAANMTVTPSLIYDDYGTTEALTTINNTNFTNSERAVKLFPSGGNVGYNNFMLKLAFTGTDVLPVALPIRIIIETLDN